MPEHRIAIAEDMERDKSKFLKLLEKHAVVCQYDGPEEYIRFVLGKFTDIDVVIAQLKAEGVSFEEAYNKSMVWPKLTPAPPKLKPTPPRSSWFSRFFGAFHLHR